MCKKIVVSFIYIFVFFIIAEMASYISFCVKQHSFGVSPVKYYTAEIMSFDSFFEYVKNGGFRKPEGLEYNSRPVVLFGCSFAWGWELERTQTLQYKLAQMMQRPVYNRAYKEFFGLSQLLYQSERQDEIKSPEYVIYVFIDDHIRRMLQFSMNPFSKYPHLKYKNHSGKLEREKTSFLNKSLFYKYLSYINANYEMDNSKEKTFLLIRQHLLQAKQNFDKHWTDYKFVFFIYEGVSYFSDEQLERLRNDGIYVVTAEELTGFPMESREYVISDTDMHPNALAWDIITPKLVNFLNEINN